MSLAQRTIESATWNITANLVSIVAGFVRFVLLARWLQREKPRYLPLYLLNF